MAISVHIATVNSASLALIKTNRHKERRDLPVVSRPPESEVFQMCYIRGDNLYVSAIKVSPPEYSLTLW